MIESNIGAPPAVEVDGVARAYRVAGDPAAPPMVLPHGLDAVDGSLDARAAH